MFDLNYKFELIGASLLALAKSTVDSRQLEPSREIEKRFELAGVRVTEGKIAVNV